MMNEKIMNELKNSAAKLGITVEEAVGMIQLMNPNLNSPYWATVIGLGNR